MLSYAELLETANFAFSRAINSLHLSKLQAFAYTYDHMETLLRDKHEVVRIGAYTSLFFCGQENAVVLVKDDQFCLDVLDELRTTFRLLPSEQGEGLGALGDERDCLKAHIDIVRKTYLM